METVHRQMMPGILDAMNRQTDRQTHSSVLLYFILFKIGHLKIKKYKFERVEDFKHWGVTLNEDNNNQTDFQKKNKNANKTYLCYKIFLKINTYQRI